MLNKSILTMMNGLIGKPEMNLYRFGNMQQQVFYSRNRIGSCAGVMEHCGMFPLDTIKVRAR